MFIPFKTNDQFQVSVSGTIITMGASASASSSSFCNPSIRDQAVKYGYFPVIAITDLANPVFANYDVRFKSIGSDEVVFEGPLMDSVPYYNSDFGDSVCGISFSARCKLVPDTHFEHVYHLVDASRISHATKEPKEPKRLITVFINKENTTDGKNEKFSLQYTIHAPTESPKRLNF